MDLSFSAIFSSLLFSGIGLYFFRIGKKESEPKIIIIGMGLMLYTYFVDSHILMWGIGFALSGWGYYEVKGKYR